MGLVLALETTTGERPPAWFSRTDSKSLLFHLGAVRGRDAREDLPRLLAHLNLSIEPLTLIVGAEEEPLESYLARDPTEERRLAWEEGHAERGAAWQRPSAIVAAIEPLLATLHGDSGDLFARLEIKDEYFTEGLFRADLEDLLSMAAWARDQHIPGVRLVIG